MNKTLTTFIYFIFTNLILISFSACKTKKHTQQTVLIKQIDTLQEKCRLPYKTSKALTKHIKENELDYKWIYAKADVEATIDGDEHNLDIRVKGRKDSALWISIYAVGGLIDVAKILITRDSVKMVNYIKKQFFLGDFHFINQILNADLDYELLQAALFGNSAEFDDDDTKLKSIIDREKCHYLLSTERKRKLKRITSGQDSLKRSLQTMTLNPETFKILINEFEEVSTNRSFRAVYEKFPLIDSVFAPRHVNIDIRAEKKVSAKINYVRIEINHPQKLVLNIPKSYEPIPIRKEQK